jgi:L-asparaginase
MKKTVRHNKHGREILVLYTGGTIGMVESPNGNKPKPGYLESILKHELKLKPNHSIGRFRLIEYHPLIDSSNVSCNDWNKITRDIIANADRYKSFIIIHGTDTMAYTASALSYSLQHLNKLVVMTGSQIPLQQLKTDGIDNLLASLIFATHFYNKLHEVVVVFADQIMRGNRCKKISSNKLNAFACPNFPNLGAFGYARLPVLNASASAIAHSYTGIKPHLYDPSVEVLVITITPGCNFKTMEQMAANPNVRGIILQTYGIGDGPILNPSFMRLLTALNERNMVIVNISQCVEGFIDMNDYETGKLMQKHNVISGHDMTLEAAYCKLWYLASDKEMTSAQIRKTLTQSLCGEISNAPTIVDVNPA